MSQQVDNKPLLESSALCGHLIRIINDELIDDPRMRINGVLIEDETFRIGFSDLKKLSYRNVVVKYSDAYFELQRAGQVNNRFWWARFQKKTKQQMIDTINDIQANRNRQAATANNGNGGGGNANAGDLVASMESVGIGGGGGGGGRAVAGAGNQELVPANEQIPANGHSLAPAIGNVGIPHPMYGNPPRISDVAQRIMWNQHVQGQQLGELREALRQRQQQGPTINISGNTISGNIVTGGNHVNHVGAPNGSVAAGAGNGAGAEPLLLGGGGAGQGRGAAETPARSTRAEDAVAMQRLVQETVQKELRQLRRGWDTTGDKLNELLSKLTDDTSKRELFPEPQRPERVGSKEALLQLIRDNSENDTVASFLAEYEDDLEDVCSFLLPLPTIMDDRSVQLIVDLVSRKDVALATNTILAFQPLGSDRIGGFLAAELDDDDDDGDDSNGSHSYESGTDGSAFLNDFMSSIAGILGGHDRFYFVDVVTARVRKTTFMLSTTSGASSTLILQPLTYLIGHIATSEHVTALVFPGGKGDVGSNGPDFIDVDFSAMLQSMGERLPLIAFEELEFTEEQLGCVVSAAQSTIRFTSCTIPCNEAGDNLLLKALAAIEPGSHRASITLRHTILLAGIVEKEIGGKVVTEEAKNAFQRARALKVLAGLVFEGKLRDIVLDYSLISRKELVALNELNAAVEGTDGKCTLDFGKHAEATGIKNQSDWKGGNIRNFLNPDHPLQLCPWSAPHGTTTGKPCGRCKEDALCKSHKHCVHH
mmetsp:Transcript_9049/g.25475  ORF Transcript_9049/g.25475 Transcript_9049/m.25475 type:complete len:765 (-) Transcript_9049:359-2653(-)